MTAFAIIQARMGSTRFPGKSMATIEGRPILWYLFRQLGHCRCLDRRILATTDSPADDALAQYATEQGWDVFRGSESDVLARYRDAAQAFGATGETVVVRITGDDIWPDPNLIDAAVNLHAAFAGLIDCVFTVGDDDLPYGVYLESYSFEALDRAASGATEADDREHVSPYMRRNPALFRRLEIAANPAIKGPSLSVDTPEDLAFNARLHGALQALQRPPYRLAWIIEASGHLDRGTAGT